QYHLPASPLSPVHPLHLIPSLPVSLSLNRTPPISTLFPYTTLFRSTNHNSISFLCAETALRQELKKRERRVCFSRHTRESVQSPDRKSTRLNSSHVSISYAVFCLKKKDSIMAESLLVPCSYPRMTR